MDIRTRKEPLERATISNPRSRASIAGYPIHPMLVPFPIAFFIATLACDIGYATTGNTGWVMASEWLLGAGLIFAGLATLAGLKDFFGCQRIRSLSAALWHMVGNFAVIALSAWNFIGRCYAGASMGLNPGLALVSAVAVVILCFSTWKGWELVYRHRIGVADY